jgi:hypothetical protein
MLHVFGLARVWPNGYSRESHSMKFPSSPVRVLPTKMKRLSVRPSKLTLEIGLDYLDP